ncbi:hypothetical protein LJR219_002156 [Phenylobacterium sp. LjRoot219]|uniref:hypothetical protein n=1 Tax=Phenylobacterium sp. LjRoot219 TaxID=3342283 RepID=UPI003ECF6CD1
MSDTDPLAGFSAAFRSAALMLGYKRTMLRRSADDITTLVLGSSHGDCGFDPGPFPGAFNLCSTSQDLRHSHAIYRRVSRNLPKLKTLVLFYSVFSPGHVLEKSPSDRVYAIALHEMLDLTLAYSELDMAQAAGSLKTRLAQWEPQANGRAGFFPELMTWRFDDSYGVDRRTAEHMKLNASSAALVYLAAIAQLARHQGHRLVVVVTPARSDYKRSCGAPAPVPFRSLTEMRVELQLGGFDVLSLWDDTRFTDAHFCDFDHIDPAGEGPALLSRTLARALGAAPSAQA